MGNVLSFLPSLSLARSTVVPTASNLPFLHSPGSSSLPPLAKSGEPERQSHRRTWTSELITPVDQEFAIRKAKLSGSELSPFICALRLIFKVNRYQCTLQKIQSMVQVAV
ncbi:hypothetical protein EV361DRAFT_898405 [Lentinula raphanica]|nr:hypothetical protein EV361DRAFT_898405 [Lentinula raphanica]